eukprot:GSA120T00008719001.1
MSCGSPRSVRRFRIWVLGTTVCSCLLLGGSSEVGWRAAVPELAMMREVVYITWSRGKA